jgi:DUF4097 and DUF4098 domain-containing protein YvlB
MKEERKRILTMVEEGKLSVDEALSLLDELQKDQKTMEQKQADIVNELSTNVHFEEAKKEDPVFDKYQSTKEKIFEFVDSALKKIKEIDLDLNFGQSVDISHIFHHADAELTNMDIDLANGSLNIVAWDQPDVRVECKAKVYRVENQDQARQNFLRDVTFALEGGKLRFLTQQKWMKLEAVMFVPKVQYDKVRVRIFNGSVTGGQLNVSDLRVKTANGKIKLEHLSGTKAEVETANGKIKLKHSQFDELEAETINGAIKVEGDFKKVDTQSFNGNVSVLLKGDRSEWVHAKTTTGPIEVYVPEGTPVDGELKTNLGGFNLNLVGVQVLEEKSEMIQKSLRFQSVNHPDKMVKIYADSKSGSITVQKSFDDKK